MIDGNGESTIFHQMGEYRLVEELGESAMFRVFKARHVKLQRDVVIKFLRDSNASDRQALARFRREMEAVGGIEHSNVVWATDAGEHEGTPYIVMEYLSGQTLQQIIAASGRLPIADACELARQAAVGLGCIHDRRMVHRDVKPSNLLLTVDGVLKLLDFGLVRLAEGSGVGDELTAASTALGTPDYIAPEQASDSRSVDCRADIYSLGCTLYECVTGAPPFAGSGHDTTVKKLLAHTQTPAPSVRAARPDVPLDLSKLLDRMLSKSPAARPSSVAEVIAALTPLSKGNRLTALLKIPQQVKSAPEVPSASNLPLTNASSPDRTVPAGRNSPVRWRVVAFATVLVAVPTIGFALWRVLNAPQPVAGDDIANDQKILADATTQADPQPADEPPVSTAGDPPVAKAVKTPQSELADLSEAVAAVAATSTVADQQGLRERLVEFSRQNVGTPERIAAAGLMSRLLWPADTRQQPSIPQEELESAGASPGHPPAELVAVFGTGRLKHWSGARAIAFSPDGTFLATPGLDGVIRVWDAKSGQPLARLQSNTWAYEAVGFTADGSTLIGGAASGWFHGWDVATWEARPPIQGQGGKLAGRWDTAWVMFSPDARLLIAAGKDNTVLLYECQTGQLIKTLVGHAAPIICVHFSGDNQVAASGDETGTAIAWDASTGSLRKKFELGHGPIRAVALNFDGKRLAAGHSDRTIALADLESDAAPRIVSVTGNVGSLAFSPDGHRLLVGSDGSGIGGLREIDLESGQVVRTFQSHLAFCQFPRYSPDGTTIACGHWDGEVSLWDATSRARRFASPNHEAEIWSVAASPDGTRLATRGKDGFMIVWNVETGAPVRKSRDGYWQKTLAFASQSDRLFVALNSDSRTRKVGFWNLSTGAFEQSLPVPGNKNLACAVLAPDDSFVVSADEKHAISVWEISGRERLILRKHTAEIDALAISPDGRLIASAGRDERIRLWDARSGDEVRTLITSPASGKVLEFSPDGKKLACGASDTKIYLWDVMTGDELAVLAGHTPYWQGILGLAYDPSGTQLASCSADGTVRIWDAETYQPRQSIAVGPSSGLIHSITFLPDGRHLATANQNGTVSLLRLESR